MEGDDRERLLATMPLHAITSTYGEAGLRDRFAFEIASWAEADRRRMQRALDLAARLHADDRRDREPYVNHLLRVAIRIISYYGVHDAEVICAALLHDAVEDHAADLAAGGGGADLTAGGGGAELTGGRADQQAALAVLAAEFSPRVAELVGVVTNPPYAGDRDEDEQYREHVADGLRDNPWARVIKASDFTDNGVGLIHTTGPRLHRLAGKYAPLVPVLADLIARPDTPLDAAVKQHILVQLDRAAERFAAVRGDAARGRSLGMPELPEVETARRLIADLALGRRITGVDDADTFVCRPHSPGELRAALTGRTLTAAHRRGKTMWCETSGLDGSDLGPILGIHLGMSGRIVVTAPDGWVAEGGDPPGRDAEPRKAEWDRFTLEFADGGRLALFDKRRLGRIVLNPDLDRLGPDAAEVTPAEFRALITTGTIAVKARLLDQSKIAGVGNLLADEALWQAKIPPATPVSRLQRKDADRLYRALRSVLASAAAKGGAHTGDVIAARRPGASCPRCGAEMVHGTVGGRSTWWCSREQAAWSPAPGDSASRQPAARRKGIFG